MIDLSAGQIVSGSLVGVLGSVLTFLGVWLTARLNAKAADRSADIAKQKQIAEQRQADIDGWQALLAEHRADRERYRAEIKDLREQMDHLTLRVERVERRYRSAVGYLREVIEWGEQAADQAVAAGVRLLRRHPPAAPAEIADEFRPRQ